MRELILVRHAKSDWSDPELSDHDRPLNARGRRAAPLMAARFAASEQQVQRVLSSPAVRARATAEEFASALGMQVELEPALYLASASTLLATAAASEVDSVLLVAHDPGITELASYLSDGGISHMPTCAVARFVWQVETWGNAIEQAADSWSFETPRDYAE